MAPVGNTARIENALYYQLAQLTLSPTRRVAWPDYKELDGSPFTPISGEIYLEPRVFWNVTDRAEIGTGAPDRYIGILQVTVKGPILVDSAPQTEIVDLIVAHFNRQVFTRNSVTVRIGSFNGGNSVPWRGGAFDADGRNIIPVSVPFWCDVFPA